MLILSMPTLSKQRNILNQYFNQIELIFSKSCVTGAWDHKVLILLKKTEKKMSHACVALIFVLTF